MSYYGLYNEIIKVKGERMYKLEIDRNTYERLKAGLREFRPNIKIELVSCDIMLEKLGFCDVAPCIVYVHLYENEMEQLQLDLLQFEIDAFNNNDEPEENDPLYILYKKYTWIYYVLICAEFIKEDN